MTDIQVKAAFLYSFTRYVDWPRSEGSESEVFAIAVLGVDPFGPVLDQTVRGRSVAGRAVAIRRIAQVEDLGDARILYISESEADQLSRILKRLEGASVLTVGETSGFAERGGVIRLRTEARRVRLDVNLTAAERVGLQISSELLKLARIVGSAGGD